MRHLAGPVPVAAGALAALALPGCSSFEGNAHGNEQMLELCLTLATAKLGIRPGASVDTTLSRAETRYDRFGGYDIKLSPVQFAGHSKPVSIGCSGDGYRNQLSVLQIDETVFRFSPPKEWEPE